jgi:hypothetical protein
VEAQMYGSTLLILTSSRDQSVTLLPSFFGTAVVTYSNHEHASVDGIVAVFIGRLNQCYARMARKKARNAQVTDEAMLQARYAHRHMSYVGWQVERNQC